MNQNNLSAIALLFIIGLEVSAIADETSYLLNTKLTIMWDYSRNNFERNLAVVIGINNYENGIHKLSTAVNDAIALADLSKH